MTIIRSLAHESEVGQIRARPKITTHFLLGPLRQLLVGLITVWTFCLVCSHSTTTLAESNSADFPGRELARAIIQDMTLDQKIGQLFIYGFSGTEFHENLESILRSYHPGGIILFGRNIKTATQVLRLNQAAQDAMLSSVGIPLLIAVDQEGGSVSRIKSQPPQPSALALANTKSVEISQRVGFFSGRMLKSLGFNMNLAPVLDTANPFSENFLGTRVFSGNSELVGEHGLAFATGLYKSGIISTLKHFPGHGDDVADPHKVIPSISDDLATLELKRLAPFKKVMDELSPPATMIAHLAIPRIDSASSSASDSKVLIQKVLRQKLKYKGIVLTDDIDMASPKSSTEKVIQALSAGIDMVMIAWNKSTRRRAHLEVNRALAQGRLSLAEIEEKLVRIISVKLQYGLFEESEASLSDVKLALKDPLLIKTFDEVTQTNIKNEVAQGSLSFGSKSPLVVISRYREFNRTFLEKQESKCCKTYSFYEIEDLNQLLQRQKDSVAIVHVSGKSTAQLLNRVRPEYRNRIVVINTTSPGLVLSAEKYLRTINLFTYHQGLGGLLATKIGTSFSTQNRIHTE